MHQIEYSNRKSIFERQNKSRSSSRTKKFQSYDQTILPSFFNKFDDCSCLDSLTICPYISKILNTSQLSLAQIKYQEIKKCAIHKEADTKNYRLRSHEKIFEPHLNNLLKVIQPNRMLPILQILKHTKCEYLTFWIYAKLCEKWPERTQFKDSVKKIAIKDQMDINFDDPQTQNKLDQIYECKLANISDKNYLKVVKMVIRQKRFWIMMTALSLIKGRERKGNQIINATIDYNPDNL